MGVLERVKGKSERVRLGGRRHRGRADRLAAPEKWVTESRAEAAAAARGSMAWVWTLQNGGPRSPKPASGLKVR